MKTNIVQIGNSRGIILPSDILRKLHLSSESAVNVSVEGKSIVIKPAPRQGWADTFKQYAMSGEEKSFFPDVFNDEDLGDIQWEKK